jgi:MFS family permease
MLLTLAIISYQYTFGFAPTRYIILLLALISLMGMPYLVLMPVFARDILHGGPHTLGFLMGTSGVGALIGAIYLASRKTVLGLGRLMVISSGTFGIGLIVFLVSNYIQLSLCMMLLTGFGMIVHMAFSNTVLQTIVGENKRGRIMSFYAMAFMGMAPFGSLLAGSLASRIGAPNTLMISGFTCVIGSLLFLAKLPLIRKLGCQQNFTNRVFQPGIHSVTLPHCMRNLTDRLHRTGDTCA